MILEVLGACVCGWFGAKAAWRLYIRHLEKNVERSRRRMFEASATMETVAVIERIKNAGRQSRI